MKIRRRILSLLLAGVLSAGSMVPGNVPAGAAETDGVLTSEQTAGTLTSEQTAGTLTSEQTAGDGGDIIAADQADSQAEDELHVTDGQISGSLSFIDEDLVQSGLLQQAPDGIISEDRDEPLSENGQLILEETEEGLADGEIPAQDADPATAGSTDAQRQTTPQVQTADQLTEGKEQVMLSIKLDFTGFPSTTSQILTGDSSRIKNYTVNVKDLTTGQPASGSPFTVTKERGENGILTLKPVYFDADYKMEPAEGSTDENPKYKEFTHSYAVSLTIPHFLDTEEKTITFTRSQVPEAQTETGQPAQTETGKAAQTETGQPAQTETGQATQTETGQPAQTETGQEAQTETGQPAQTETGQATGQTTVRQSVPAQAQRESLPAETAQTDGKMEDLTVETVQTVQGSSLPAETAQAADQAEELPAETAQVQTEERQLTRSPESSEQETVSAEGASEGSAQTAEASEETGADEELTEEAAADGMQADAGRIVDAAAADDSSSTTAPAEGTGTGESTTAPVETEKPKKLPTFTWHLTADGIRSNEKDHGATMTFAPKVDVDSRTYTDVDVTSLTRISRPSGTSLQGGTLTQNYIVSGFKQPAGSYVNPLVLLNRNSLKVAVTTNSTVSLGHLNDMTYVAPANEIYTTSAKADDGKYYVTVMDASSLVVKRRILMDGYYNGIAYDDQNNRFFLTRGDNSLMTVYIFDSELRPTGQSFPVKSNVTSQGCGVWNGLFYFTGYEHGTASQYEPVPDGTLKKGDNIIAIYSAEGQLLKTYRIPASSDGKHNEIEAIMFDNGRMILQFNENGRVGYYAVSPQNAAATLTAYVTVDNGTAQDGKFTAGLYKNDERLSSAKNIGGAFTFALQVSEPGQFIYQILQDTGKDTANYIYSRQVVSFRVTALYDPYTNQMDLKTECISDQTIRNYRMSVDENLDIKAIRKTRGTVNKLRAKKRRITVWCRKVKAADGYDIEICRNRKFTGNTLRIVPGPKRKRILKGLKRKTRYYIRIRPYKVVHGRTYFGKYSKIKSIRTK